VVFRVNFVGSGGVKIRVDRNKGMVVVLLTNEEFFHFRVLNIWRKNCALQSACVVVVVVVFVVITRRNIEISGCGCCNRLHYKIKIMFQVTRERVCVKTSVIGGGGGVVGVGGVWCWWCSCCCFSYFFGDGGSGRHGDRERKL
jgi:hypothetical protein